MVYNGWCQAWHLAFDMKTEHFRAQMPNAKPDTSRVSIRLVNNQDRPALYRLRHQVYASELKQHTENAGQQLTDGLDEFNTYIGAYKNAELVGFISITPPGQRYSIEKYLDRSELPFKCDDRLYEVRLLTVSETYRGTWLAALLMYAAFRWVESHGGTRILGMGRRELLTFYEKAGLQLLGKPIRSGQVWFELMTADIESVRSGFSHFSGFIERMRNGTDWRLPVPWDQPASCFHGGAFFSAIGEQFDTLEKSRTVINADVLDAWFPPAPKVLQALREYLPWIARTSPPTDCGGLIETIAAVRGLRADALLPGAGSSDLIFRAFRQWLHARSRVLLLDPTYGEYNHVLQNVIGCRVDRFTIAADNGYEVDVERFIATVSEGRYDLAVLVNPNSPTGRPITRSALEPVLKRIPPETLLWIDETYTDYAGPHESLEQVAMRRDNVVICKSMSKVYALSGLRAAYLCASPHLLEVLRSVTPPWVIGLPGQIAAVLALQDPHYYATCYDQTHRLAAALSADLNATGAMDVVPSVINGVLCHLKPESPDAETVVKRCREHGLFIRNAGGMGSGLGERVIRIAVKDAETNRRMIEILKQATQLVSGLAFGICDNRTFSRSNAKCQA